MKRPCDTLGIGCATRIIGCLGVILAFGCVPPTIDCGEAGAAPEVELPLLNGVATRSIRAYRGKVIYLDFWGSWCLPCRDSLPFLNDIRNRLSRDDFEVLAINLDEEAQDATRFLESYPVDYPVLADPDRLTASIYGVEVVPSSFLIDRQGRICTSHVGFKSAHKTTIVQEIRALLSRPSGAFQ